MRKAVVYCLSLFVFVTLLNGCASTRRQKDLELQGLRNQISALETQIQVKDEEIGSLREALDKAVQEEALAAKKQAAKKEAVGEVKCRPTVKHIQTALKNAGYEPGAIDGKMGKLTREAIKAFQKANNLPADGKVGKKTWGLLREYLYKKIK